MDENTEFNVDGRRAVKWVIWSVVALIVIGFAWWGASVLLSGPIGVGEMHKQIQSAEYRREAYEYFYNQQASIKTLEGQIDVFVDQLKDLEKGTREYNMTLTNLAGVKGLRHKAIQDYNAAARKIKTSGQFLANDLPYQIPDTEYPMEVGK